MEWCIKFVFDRISSLSLLRGAWVQPHQRTVLSDTKYIKDAVRGLNSTKLFAWANC